MRRINRLKQKISALLCFFMIITLCPNLFIFSPVTASAESVSNRFIDSFADGNANGWSLPSATWAVEQVADGPAGVPANVLSQNKNSAAAEVVLIGDQSWTDYTVQMKMRTMVMSSGGNGAIVFRAADNKNFYFFRFIENAGGSRSVQLMKIVNGAASLLQNAPYAWTEETWYDVKISATGPDIEVSVDGQAVIDYTGIAGELEAGGIGLRSYLVEMQVGRVEAAGEIALPAQEMGLGAAIAEGGIELNWQASQEPEASSYKVLRGEWDELAGQVQYATVTEGVYGTSFLDTLVSNNQEYHYYVEVEDGSGDSFARSEIVTITYLQEPALPLTRFIDSFADGNASGWSLPSATWAVKEVADGPAGSPSHVLSQNKNSSAAEVALIGDQSWTDYTVQMKMRTLNLTTSGGNSAIVFRAADNRNYYFFRFIENAGGNRAVQLMKMIDGSASSLQNTPYSWSEETWYDVQIAAEGPDVEVSVDGQAVIDYTGTAGELEAGGIGFRSYLTEMQVDRVEAAGKITLPAQGMGLGATIAEGGIALSWQASQEPEAASCKLYRGESNPASEPVEFEVLAEALTATSYFDSTAAEGHTYYYYIEVQDASGQAFAKSAQVKAAPLSGITKSTLENDKFKLQFFETTIAGQTVIAKRVYLADGAGGWNLLPINPADEKYAVIHAADAELGKQLFTQDNEQTHPVWTTSSVIQDPNIFHAGTVYQVRPTEIEDGIGQVVMRTVQPGFTVEWTWTLPAGEAWPQVEQSLQVGSDGYWTVVSQEMFEKQAAEVNNIQLGFLINQKRVPATPYVVPEYQLPNPAALVEIPTVNFGNMTFGLAPDAGEIPINRMAKLDTSRFGLMITNEAGGIQPGLAAPLLGTDESYMREGESYSFKYHYIIEQGGWWDAYERIATDLLGFHDYRTSWQTSLTDAIHNMTDLLMDDTYSGWWDLAKSFIYVEKNNTSEIANNTAAMQAYLLTGNEDIYRKRVLPTIEYLLSRNSNVFSPVTGNKPSEVSSDLGGPSAGPSTLLPLYELGKRSTGVLYHKAVEELAKGKWKSIQEQLAAYRITNDAVYLTEARKIADTIVAGIDSASTTPNSGSAFVYSNFSEFESLLEFYELTKESKYLTAAEKAAQMFMTSVWMQPVPDANSTITVPDEAIPRSPYVYWSGRLGWPYDEADLQETVNAWIPSQAGLSLEQGTTYEALGGNGNVMNPGWASYLLRLSALTNEPFYKDVARSSIVGRYGNYPGYYYKQYAVTQMDPMYPYEGPDITDIYYHHIPVQLGLTVDFLMEELRYRSNDQIEFAGQIDPGLGGVNGYLWFKMKAYGNEPGEMYGREGMHLWLPEGLVDTGTPEVSWIGATDGERLGIALLSYDDQALNTTITLDTGLMGAGSNGEVTLVDEAGTETAVQMTDGKVALSIPAKGLRTLFLEGVHISLPSMQFEGTGLTPEQQQASYNKVDTEVAQLGTIEGDLIIHNDEDYDAYVFTDVKDDLVKEAYLHYNDGNGWQTAVKKEYPFEFSVGPIPQERSFQYILETRTASGEVNFSDSFKLEVTTLLSWKQQRLDRRLNQAELLVDDSADIQGALTGQELADLEDGLNDLQGGTVITDTENEGPSATQSLLAYSSTLAQLTQWLEGKLPRGANEDTNALYRAIDQASSLILGRLQELLAVEVTVVGSGEWSVLQGGEATLTIQLINSYSEALGNGELSIQLPEYLHTAGESAVIAVPQLQPGGTFSQTWTVQADSEITAGLHVLPVRYSYTIDGTSMTGDRAVPLKVNAKLRMELLDDHPIFLAGEPKEFAVRIFNDGPAAIDGQVQLGLPAAWSVSGDLSFTGLASGSAVTKSFILTAPSDSEAGDYLYTIAAEENGGASVQLEWRAQVSRNVALSAFGSIATASSELGNNTGMQAIDGGNVLPTTNRWTSLAEGPHSLVIDFGQAREIDRVCVIHFGAAGSPDLNTSGFQIQSGSSPDGPWTDLVAPIQNNTLSITDHVFAPTSTQYIRLYITQGSPTDDYARIFEVEAYLAQGQDEDNGGNIGGNNGSENGGDNSENDIVNGNSNRSDGRIVQATVPAGAAGTHGMNDEMIVSIPAGASRQEMKLTIEKLSDITGLTTDNRPLLTPVFEILKDFANNFSKPVTLTFKFDASALREGEIPSIFYYDEQSKTWIEMGGDAEGELISVETNHFTKFAVFAVESKDDAATEPGFADIAGHWAESVIQEALSQGFIQGFPDGTFQPDKTMTRAEFIAMLANALKLEGDGAKTAFADAAQIGQWASRSIALAIQASIVSGYPDGTFRPNAAVTRAEMAVMLAQAFASDLIPKEAVSFADDGEIPAWAKDAAYLLKSSGIIRGRDGNRFEPAQPTTRAEAVTAILNLLKQA